jgi:multiple sugar transport system permease protein
MSTTNLIRPAEVPRPPTAARKRRRRRPEGAAYVFLLPWILGAAVLTVGPMAASLYLSLTDYDLFNAPTWVALDNYQRLFEDPRYLQAVRVTLAYVVLAVPLKLGLALAVALLLNRKHRGKGLYRSAFYAPSLLGASVSIALVWRAMFDDGGALDRFLGVFGVQSEGWVTNPSTSLYVLVALAVWQFGAPMVIFLAGLKQIPGELYEAAALDGAKRIRTFISITVPMLSPVIFFNLVLETIHAFQAFTGAFVVSGGRGGPSDSTLFYTLYLYERGFSDFQMGYASAMAWTLLAAVAVITVLLFRSQRSWVHYTGEEGR